MQWCCSAGEWDVPHQLDLARWVDIQPRLLVRSISAWPRPCKFSHTSVQKPGPLLGLTEGIQGSDASHQEGTSMEACSRVQNLPSDKVLGYMCVTYGSTCMYLVLLCSDDPLKIARDAPPHQVQQCRCCTVTMQVTWTQDGLANAWRTPTLRRPAVCEMLQGINKEFARDYENHPCNFLKKGW